MNQDQDFNKDDRRDGERRSVGRRDDGPRPNDRPRTEGPRNTGPRAGGFNKDRNSGPRNGDFNRDDKPRFGDRKEGGPRQAGFNRDDKPRYGDRKEGGPRQGGPRQESYPRPAGDRDNGSRKPWVKREGDSRDGGRGNDRPSFDRDKRDTSDRREGGPRQGGFRNDGPRGGGFNRDDKPRYGGSREGGSRDGNAPYFKREDSPRDGGSAENKTSRFGNERRFDDRRSNDRPRNDNPREGGYSRDRNDGPRNERDGSADRPRFSREGGPREGGFNRDRGTDGPRGPRNDEAGGERKPRFERDDRRNDGPREGGFTRDRTTDSRESGPRSERPRFDGPRDNRYGDKPKFDRAPSPRDYDRKETRPRVTAPRDEEPRDPAAKPLDNELDKRFSSEQREDSRGRQVGKFKRAPDYNRGTFAKPSFDKKGDDKKKPGNRFEKPRSERNAGPRAEIPRNPSAPDHNDRDAAGLMRLNRYIANAGVCSRREADELIGRGDITVNGKVVTEMGYKVQENDIVKYGKTTLNPEKLVYVLLNKPKDYLTTTEDPEERRTVMELVADAGNYRIYPVGRLDRNTTGLLLMTNDGELADKLTHPSNNVRKIYQAELDKPITEEHFEAIKAGVELEDGLIKPDELAIVTPDAYVVGIEIHSGRNRIVRRIFEHFGYEVTKLDRTIYAGLTKKELPRGKWRFLEPKEVIKLKYLN